MLEDYSQLKEKAAQVPRDAETESSKLKSDLEGVYNTILRNSRTLVRELSQQIEKLIKENNVRIARQKLKELSALEPVNLLLNREDRLLLAQDIESAEQLLVTAEAQLLPRIFAEVQKKIDDQLQKGSQALQAKDWTAVNSAGNQLMELRQELPEELVDQYASYASRINHFLESWVQMKAESQRTDFKEKSDSIAKLIAGANQSLQQGKDAFESYTSAHQLFDNLPVGFLEERTAIHKQLSVLLESLTKPAARSSRPEASSQELKATSNKPPASLESIPVPKPARGSRPEASSPIQQATSREPQATGYRLPATSFQPTANSLPLLLSRAESLSKIDRKKAREAYTKLVELVKGTPIAPEDRARLTKLYDSLK